jgi:predicted dehydrogenase/kynurenine formamidase
MSDLFAPIRDAVRLEVPEAHKRPVAIVGAGEIVDLAHLPVYGAHGIAVVGITDLDRDRAADVAKRHNIPTVYESVEELATDADVAVVDIAVYPWAQGAIATQLLDAGKHLLCQKPLSYDIAEAEQVVAHAEQYDRRLAVNLQLRYSEGIAATKAMVAAGWIGDPVEVSFDFHVYTPWEHWAWVTDLDRLDLRQHTIHYLDAVRYIIGEPHYAYGTQAREPSQPEKGDTRTISVLEFDGELRACLKVFHKNRTGDPRAEFRFDGTEGGIRGTIGLMYNYPHGRVDTIELSSRVVPTDGWVPYPVTTRWIPDAFAGPMASLLEAVATRSQPLTNGRDHLMTLRLVDALYTSGSQHRVVDLTASPNPHAVQVPHTPHTAPTQRIAHQPPADGSNPVHTPDFPTETALDTLFDEVSNKGRWGAGDQLGTLNHITTETRRAAAQLVREGHAVSIGRDLDTVQSPNNPSPVRHTMAYQAHTPIGAVDEIAMNLHGFANTHLDAIAHVYRGEDVYNGRSAPDVVTGAGLTFGDICAQRDGIFTRGVVLDIAGARGVDWLAPDDRVTVADLVAAEEAEGIRVGTADAVFLYVGLQKREAAEGPESLAERCGIMPEVIGWMHEREISVYSGDCIEVFPNPYGPRYAIYLHSIGLAAMGLVLLDIPAMEPLVEACRAHGRSDFLLSMAPLRLKGGTGSPVNPTALF